MIFMKFLAVMFSCLGTNTGKVNGIYIIHSKLEFYQVTLTEGGESIGKENVNNDR